jgi:hypothetical protein
LLAANKRLNTAYLLKESFGQLWDYQREGWARRFFEHWRASLKWQRLPSYVKFAEMIDRHWDGIAAYCKPENKVSLGRELIKLPAYLSALYYLVRPARLIHKKRLSLSIRGGNPTL